MTTSNPQTTDLLQTTELVLQALTARFDKERQNLRTDPNHGAEMIFLGQEIFIAVELEIRLLAELGHPLTGVGWR